MPAPKPAEGPWEVFAECADWLLVIGGHAVQSYGMDRLTYDCDCAVLDRNEETLKAKLASIGYVLNDRQAHFSRYVHLGRQRAVVDVMRLDAKTFALLSTGARETQIGEKCVRVPRAFHLLAMKLHALKQNPERAHKDWADICHLLDF